MNIYSQIIKPEKMDAGTNNGSLGKILNDVAPEKCFWINNGPVVRNLYELSSAIKNMRRETFIHHANGDKNDISKWVREVLNDEMLADDLLRTSTKESAYKIISKRISSIEKILGKSKIIFHSADTRNEKDTQNDSYTLNNLISVFVLGVVVGIIIGLFAY